MVASGTEKSNLTSVGAARFDKLDPLIVQSNAQMGWVSDAVAEVLRRLDVRYLTLNPGASYRGLHDSLVNYLGNRDPKLMVCMHEEHAVGIAQGYGRVTGRPMAVALHANVGLMHATMAIFSAWCSRDPILLIGATGPGDAEVRRPWTDWIHTSKDQGALIRHYTKWDDEPRSAGAAIESVVRAWQIASTPPYGPTYVCLDAGLQEEPLSASVKFPDLNRFQPGSPPAPSPEDVEQAAALLLNAKKPVILMGRVSRNIEDWQARIALAESLGAIVLTDFKTPASFPTHHQLHPAEPRGRPNRQTADLTKDADVILALDWMDLKGHFDQTYGKGIEPTAKIIHCSIDEHLHNGWSMDYCGLPPADLKFLCSPDMLVHPLLAVVRKQLGAQEKPAPKFTLRREKELDRPREGEVMTLRDMALIMREFCDSRDVTIANYALGWPTDTVRFSHPLDYLGYGTGIGLGPSRSVGVALAIKDTGRLPVAIVGDGDFTMGNTAIWTAVHMGIPLLVIVANNQVYNNDVGHQAHVAKVRGRPVQNKFIGQEMMNPACDLAGMAKSQGADGEGPVMNSAGFREALSRGEVVVRAGGVYVIDARIDVNVPEDEERGQTSGRHS